MRALLFCLTLTLALGPQVPIRAQRAASRPTLPPLTAHDARINALIQQMTLAEKVAFVHANSAFTNPGVPRLGVPELVMSDGPHGVRPEQGRTWQAPPPAAADSGTYLPVGVALGATWNPALGYAFGTTLGQEAAARGKDVILGPGINIMRSPLNGRNFEYLSEDPYLVSQMVVGYVRGVQDQGVAACVKHYALNNQETNRFKVNVEVSERALREIYLPGFRAAVRQGGVYTVMSAYNLVRGHYASQSDYLLNQVLKKEWGFQGAVISDWAAVHNTLEAARAGLDLEMGTDLDMLPNPNYNRFFFGDSLLALVRRGRVPEAVLDDKVRRLLRVMYATHVPDKSQRPAGSRNTAAHQATARQVAEEAVVLLKNFGDFLPLQKDKLKRVAVIGANATRLNAYGGGSSQVRAKFEITPLQGLRDELGAGVEVIAVPGYRIGRGQRADPVLIAEAVAAAKAADEAVVVVGWTHGYDYAKWADNAYDAENTDKPDLPLPFGQDELITAVLVANLRTVVVLVGGGPADVSAWAPSAPAIVQAWYGGQAGGAALAGVLLGRVNPSGKLPVTFPVHLDDVPAQKLGEYGYGKARPDSATVRYKDDIFVGYRYYDTYKVAPEFAFGHGLSYTTFGYSNLRVVPGPQSVRVSFTLTNTGRRAGAEVAQLYVQAPGGGPVPRAAQELKGFEKVQLAPGQARTVTLVLDRRAFEYYDEAGKKWALVPGSYGLRVGSSSRDLRLTGAVAR